MSARTKAEILADLDAAEHEVEALRSKLAGVNRRIDSVDPEAACISECVAAIETLNGKSAANRDRYGVAVHRAPDHDGVTDSMIGRVLLNLAHRYSVPLVPKPPIPDPQPPESDLSMIVAPNDVAPMIERAVEQVLEQRRWLR